MVILKLYKIIKFIISHPLNKKNPIKAIIKFINWQIYSKFFNKRKEFKWIESSKLVAYKSESACTGNLYTGMCEFNEMGFLIHFLKINDVFVDIGANSGAYTVLASKVIGARSICIEPINQAIIRVKEHLKINQIQNLVELHNIGLGNNEEQVTFTTDKDSTNHVLPYSSPSNLNTILQNVKTLDSILNFREEYILKIDTEGYEFNILKGASKILKNGNILAIIIEVNGSGNRYGFTNKHIHDELNSYGYIPIEYDPKSKKIDNCKNLNENINYIYVKDIKLAINRINNSKSYKIRSNNDYCI